MALSASLIQMVELKPGTLRQRRARDAEARNEKAAASSRSWVHMGDLLDLGLGRRNLLACDLQRQHDVARRLLRLRRWPVCRRLLLLHVVRRRRRRASTTRQRQRQRGSSGCADRRADRFRQPDLRQHSVARTLRRILAPRAPTKLVLKTHERVLSPPACAAARPSSGADDF